MIVQAPDPILNTVCAEIADPEDPKWAALSESLFEWMEKGDRHGPGLGLSAPQLGSAVQMFVVRSFPMPFLNARIDWQSPETAAMHEGCLSVPGVKVLVRRHAAVTIRAQSLAGVWKKWKLRGMDARVAQHELDHLAGMLITDYPIWD